MINQLGIIENELKHIQAEIPKKQNTLKDAFTNALVLLTAFKNSKDNTATFPIDEIIKPLPQVIALKNPKLIAQVLNLLQTVLSFGFAGHKQLITVMGFLHDILEIQDDTIHLKILQTMLVCITPKYLDFNDFQIIEKLLTLIVQMYSSKNVMIHNPASAALFQLSSLIFEQFIVYIKATKLQDQSANINQYGLTHASYQKSIQLLRDFILIANGQKPSWIPNNINLPRTIGFDLLNDILKQTTAVLKQSKEAHQLIRKDFIPTLTQNFDSKQLDFLGLLRTLRAATRILITLDDGLELIDNIVAFLHRAEHEYERFLCIEAFHTICSAPTLIVTLNERRTSNSSYFTEILNNLVKVGTDIQNDADFQKKRAIPLSAKLFKILDSNVSEFEPSHITSVQTHKSISDTIAAVTQTLFVLAEKAGFALGTPQNAASTDEQKSLVEWLSVNWKVLLKALKALLAKDTDEVLTQNILNTFQKLINLFGSLNFTQARDSYILALCQACLPQDDRSLRELSLKNIQTTKIVFNIAHCFGAILDIPSWHSIFVTLQKTEMLFDRVRSQIAFQPQTPSAKTGNVRFDQDKSAVQRLMSQDTQSSLNMDMEILGSALDSLFTQSSHYPIAHFKPFLEALHQLSLDYLEKATSPDYLIIEGVLVEPKTKIFGLARMLESTLVNLDRIEEFWGIVLAFYVCVTTNSKNLILRNRGVENLNTLTEKVFQYFSTRKNRWDSPKANGAASEENKEEEKIAEESEKHQKYSEDWNRETWQQIIFQPWLEISKTRFSDVKENVCSSLLKLLQNNGHEIDKNGWKSISLILLEVSQDSVGNTARLGFKCLETAVGDYLQDFEIESVKTLVEVVENFKNVSKDNNISYQSVGMFWKIGDYIAKLQDQEHKAGRDGILGFEEVWMFILNRLLSDAQSDHTELRTSAIHTFANLMIHHGNSLGLKLWNTVISDMIFKLVDELLESFLRSTRETSPAPSPGLKDSANLSTETGRNNTQNDNAIITNVTKKWEESLVVLMQNFIKMMKKYLILVEKIEDLNPQTPEIIVLRNTLSKLRGIIMVARNDVITESIKFFHEIVSAQPEVLQHILDSIFEVFEIIKAFLVEVRQNAKEIKIILNKFIPEVLEILKELFEPSRYQILNPNKVPYERHLFAIIEKAIFYSKQAENYNAMVTTARVMIDVKPVYDFLDQIPSTLCQGNDNMTAQYFQFIISALSYPVTDKFTDGVVRKIITTLDDAINKKAFNKNTYLPHLPKIFEKMKDIFCLRSNNEFLVLASGSTLKTTYPIWLYLTDYFHKIVVHVLDDYRSQITEARDKDASLDPEIEKEYNELSSQIIDIYEKILKEGQKNIESISKGILAEIKKDWLEMDMKFINSIANTLVPSFALVNYDLLWKLIAILDFAFSFHTKNPALTQSSSTYSGSYVRDASSNAHISKITLEILFRISDSDQNQQPIKDSSEQSKKNNLTKFAAQKLILKCKSILKEYIYDENRSGNMPLPRVRTLEIADILEKLRRLQIPPNSFLILESQPEVQDDSIASETEESVEDKGLDFSQLQGTFEQLSLIKIYSKQKKNESLVQGPKGHLVYLMPIFSEFITCKDADLKVLIKKIFIEISKEVV